MQRQFIRNIYAEKYFERFLIFAIGTIVVVRAFLAFTGYPQIGGGNFHIAHMLWGGLLMLVAIILVMAFINQFVLYLASIFGGIGFGLFIDELGKFVTSDNDYFFKPTFAMIYVIFLLIYFIFRFIDQKLQHSPDESKMNILEIAKLDVIDKLTHEDLFMAKQELARIPESDDQKLKYAKMIVTMQADIKNRNDIIDRIENSLKGIYHRALQFKYLPHFIVTVMLINTASNIGYLIFNDVITEGMFIGMVLSTVITAIVTLIGVYWLIKGDKLRAFKTLSIAILISILVTTIFQFYYDQLWAIISLCSKLIGYSMIQFMIRQIEREKIEENEE